MIMPSEDQSSQEEVQVFGVEELCVINNCEVCDTDGTCISCPPTWYLDKINGNCFADIFGHSLILKEDKDHKNVTMTNANQFLEDVKSTSPPDTDVSVEELHIDERAEKHENFNPESDLTCPEGFWPRTDLKTLISHIHN